MENVIYDKEELERIFNTYKKCAICKEVKHLIDDYPSRKSDCLICRKKLNQVYYQKKKKISLERTLEIS